MPKILALSRVVPEKSLKTLGYDVVLKQLNAGVAVILNLVFQGIGGYVSKSDKYAGKAVQEVIPKEKQPLVELAMTLLTSFPRCFPYNESEAHQSVLLPV